MPDPTLALALARAFLAGEWNAEAATSRGAHTLGRPWLWLRPLAERFLTAFAGGTRPREREAVAFLLRDSGFIEACETYRPQVERQSLEPFTMQPAAAAIAWPVPAIESSRALAEWLGVDLGQLDWFANLAGIGGGKLHHYHYRVVPKRSGGVRVIEAPKTRLKELQRRILAGILEKIPAHAAAHGFVKGRSIRTFAAPHAGQPAVLRMDLRDFFASIPGVRIQALFPTAGYPETVADLLGGLCTNAAAVGPRDPYARPHLPQGAPTSPALANLCAYRADCRLAGLAKAAGMKYTRYADDLAFSGPARFARFAPLAAAILIEEGFHPHHRKTRLMRQGVRQQLTGLVVNQRVNIARDRLELLEAILVNCVRRGPETQNRDAHPRFREHLEGRVSFVESIRPDKGRRLRTLFSQVAWPPYSGSANE